MGNYINLLSHSIIYICIGSSCSARAGTRALTLSLSTCYIQFLFLLLLIEDACTRIIIIMTRSVYSVMWTRAACIAFSEWNREGSPRSIHCHFCNTVAPLSETLIDQYFATGPSLSATAPPPVTLFLKKKKLFIHAGGERERKKNFR